MHTLYDKVRSLRNRALWKILRQPKMRAVCFIDNQRYSTGMYCLCNTGNVRHHTIIGRGSEDYCCIILFRGTCLLDLLHGNLSEYPRLRKLRIDIIHIQLPQRQCMVDRLVTVPRHKNPLPPLRRRTDCSKQTAGASVYQIKALPCTIQTGSSLLRLL